MWLIKFWQKIKDRWNWIKRQWFKFVGGIAIAATITTPIIIDLTKNEVSLEKITLKYEQSTEIKAEYQQDGSSLKREAKSDSKDRIEIIVGDKDKAEFSPDTQLSRWDEVSFKIKPNLDGIATKDKDLKFEGEKIKFETPDIDYHLYELPIDATNTEGAYEYEVLLKSKPTTNKIEFTLQTKNLDFFYQSELTQKEIDEGAFRPENVVGSYAVYHSGNPVNYVGGKEYKTGKAFHIYRPKITDAIGNEIWGELNINEQAGIMSITIDQNWLDSAVYPVMVDPTFGYTSIGASTDSNGADAADFSRLTTPSDISTVSSVSVYVYKATGTGNIN